jgi:hypothetical protein
MDNFAITEAPTINFDKILRPKNSEKKEKVSGQKMPVNRLRGENYSIEEWIGCLSSPDWVDIEALDHTCLPSK